MIDLLKKQVKSILKNNDGNDTVVKEAEVPGAWMKHPNPQERREQWMSLNGTWSLNDSDILVPFCPESRLSGFAGNLMNETGSMYYEKSFRVNPSLDKWKESTRYLLHFDGVDQKFTAILNDTPIGFHEDGYTKAVFDVTESINKKGDNRLKVIAIDRLDKTLPYGKQKKNRGGMWYTPCSGIWKSVWIEAVPERHIEGIRIETTLSSIKLKMNYGDFPCENVRIKIGVPQLKNLQNAEKTEGAKDEYFSFSFLVDQNAIESNIQIDLNDKVTNLGNPFPVKNWCPEEPWLYDLTIDAGEDRVCTYFGLRTVSLGTAEKANRIFLNGKPVFLHGVLDQGYYSDGLYLPKEEEEYERDILRMKELGFNTLRKHIKVESDWFYYYCDIHGMLVMQDMVNSGHYRYMRDTILPTFGFKINDEKLRTVSSRRKHNFVVHVRNVQEMVYDHPSVIAYTIFNEGWGQHTSDHYYRYLKSLDPSRIIDTTSGWFAGMESDFDSRHVYFWLRKILPDKRYKEKPILISECGGYSFAVSGHVESKKTYGYGVCKSEKELMSKINRMYDEMIIPGIPQGISGCIYTQLSDVEDEINGLYTYDREVLKADSEQFKTIREKIDAAFSECV